MSSQCEQHRIVLSGWLDGAFEPADAVPLLDHLARCGRCREFYREARALDGLIAGLREPGAAEPPPPEVWSRIRTAAAPPAPRSRLPVWGLRAAAVLLVAVGLALVLWPAPPAERPAEIEVLLGAEADSMTEDRFVEITTEVLKADRRFHRAMHRVMEQVISDTEPREGSVNERQGRRESESAPEPEGESANLERPLA